MSLESTPTSKLHSFGTLGSAIMVEGRVLRGLGRMVAKKPVTHSVNPPGVRFYFL